MDLPLDIIRSYFLGFKLYVVCKKFLPIKNEELRLKRLYSKIRNSIKPWLLRARCRTSVCRSPSVQLEEVEVNKNYISNYLISYGSSIITNWESQYSLGVFHNVLSIMMQIGQAFCGMRIFTKNEFVNIEVQFGNGLPALKWNKVKNGEMILPPNGPFPPTRWAFFCIMFDNPVETCILYKCSIPNSTKPILYTPYYLCRSDDFIYTLNMDSRKQLRV